jgi:hypothetical protein
MTHQLRLVVALAAIAAAGALFATQLGALGGSRGTTAQDPTAQGETVSPAVRSERCRAVNVWQQTRAQGDPDPLAALRQAPDLEAARVQALRILDDQVAAIAPVVALLERPGAPLTAAERQAAEAASEELTGARARIVAADPRNPTAFAGTLVHELHETADLSAMLAGAACPPRS